MLSTLFSALCFGAFAHAAVLPTQTPIEPPSGQEVLVDLGYERHVGTQGTFDKFFSFKNIPYAKPPIGELRFAAAQRIIDDSDKINNGSRSAICPQGPSGWFKNQVAVVEDYFKLADLPADSIKDPGSDRGDPPKPSEDESEDCLLLDVYVPEDTWKNRTKDEYYPLPVLVWFHGGGFVYGNKDQHGSPSGLLNQSIQGDPSYATMEGVVVVTVNYRLGAFGFMTSPKYIKEGGQPNAGLYDQFVALEWVRDNIGKLCGDPGRVTVMGESAGAASIMHHLTAWGGPRNFRRQPRAPFQRAIIQSPAFFPLADDKQEEKIYSAFLKASGAGSVKDLQKADTKDLMRANAKMNWNAPYGRFAFGPAEDEGYVPAPPQLLMKYGRQWRDVDVIVSTNKEEGLLFTPPYVQTDDDFSALLKEVMPALDNDTVTEILSLYPMPGPSLTPRKDRMARVSQAFQEVAVKCNAHFITKTYARSYKYIFNHVPAIHGQDTAYTFFDGVPQKSIALVNERKVLNAMRMQAHFVAFAKYADPNDVPEEANLTLKDWPEYGYNNEVLRFWDGGLLNISAIDIIADPLTTSNCELWEDAPWWNADEDVVAKASVSDNVFDDIHSMFGSNDL